jgi:GMP synthase (glutamine-hydrolysing)
MTLPPDSPATILAFNEVDDYHAMRIGPTAWTVQFHPEYKAKFLRSVIPTTADPGTPAEQVEKTVASVSDEGDAVGELLLQRFVNICIQSSKL